MRPRVPNKTELSEAPGETGLDALSVLLDEIERETVPDRLLTLAQQLQAALVARREREPSQD